MYIYLIAIFIVFCIILVIFIRSRWKPIIKPKKFTLLDENFSSFFRMSKYWNCYSLFSTQIDTTKEKYLKINSNNYFEIAVYDSETLSIIKSGLYAPNNNFSIKIKENDNPVYIFIWTRDVLEAYMNDKPINLPVNEIDRIADIETDMAIVDLNMDVLYQSQVKEDIFPDIDEDYIGPFSIGFKFTFDLNVGQSAACIGYDLTNTNNNISVEKTSVKIIDTPGFHEEVESMFCKKYEMN